MAEIVSLQPGGRPAKSWIASTPTLGAVHHALNIARENGRIVVVAGPSGCGKTTALNAYREKHGRQVAFLSIREADTLEVGKPHRGAAALLYRIMEALDAYTYSETSLSSLYRSVVERLGHGWNTSVVVIDEAHRLGPHALQVLRDINNETSCGIALSGEPRLIETIKRNGKFLASFVNRAGAVVRLDVHLQDVEAIASHFGFPAAAVAELMEIGKTGGLHRVMAAVQLVDDRVAGKPPSLEVVREAIAASGFGSGDAR